MKRYRSLMEMLIIVGLFIWIGSAGAEQIVAAEAAKVPATDVGYLENITFEKLKGKERVVLVLSRQSGATAEDQGEKAIAVRIENLFIPQNLLRAMGEGSLDNLIRVVPAQRTAGGRPQALIGMELNRRAPYSVRQDGHNVIIDFNVASLPAKPAGPGAGDKQAPPEQAQVKAAAPAQKPPAQKPTAQKPPAQPNTGRLVSLDFQEAGIKSVLKLLAEESGINIVSGDDVKGNITISMKKVPWQQALETILAITDMTSLQEGDIIRVITKTKLSDLQKRADDDAKRIRVAAEDKDKQEQLKKAETGKLQQVSIEAKIIEANTSFVRKLGVQWGGDYTGTLRAAKGVYPYGIGIGTNPSATNPLAVGSGIGLTPTGMAVNLPAAVAAPSIGLVVGTANAVLSAQLSALETSTEGRIISTPRVVIMEGEKAVIKQGEEIPVVTPASANSPATTTYKPAELKLEVTPKITVDGRISMTISATNNRPNRAEKDIATGNMPIFTNQVDSKVVIRDGDTIVIGGVMKSEESKVDAGVPWVYKVPVLGWLFKQETLERTKRELLIFVTPKIVKSM
jgi:type IV pilus assembly protein PilQ